MNEELTKLQSEMQAQLASLAHKHAHVSFALIGVLALVLGLMTAGGIVAVKYTNAQLAKADAVDAQYKSDKAKWEQERSQLQNQIDAASQKQQVLVKVIHDRDQTADQQIAQAKDPSADAQKVAADTEHLYGFAPTVEPASVPACLACPSEMFEFNKEEVQTFNATKIDRDRLAADLDGTKQSLILETDKFDDLLVANGSLKTQNTQCEQDLANYKKVAKLSRFKKFLHGAERVGEIALSAVAGYEVGHHLPFQGKL